MNRPLKPAFFILIVGGEEFSQKIEVYEIPSIGHTLTINTQTADFDFKVIDVNHNLTMYINRAYQLDDKAPEAIIAIPCNTLLNSDHVRIQNALRAESKKPWKENGLSVRCGMLAEMFLNDKNPLVTKMDISKPSLIDWFVLILDIFLFGYCTFELIYFHSWPMIGGIVLSIMIFSCTLSKFRSYKKAKL
jgi:hypothetical protein